MPPTYITREHGTELIENTLRRKHLEEMMDRPEKEHTPLEGMDNEQIKRFALFLFEENQNKSKQLDEIGMERPYRKGMTYSKAWVGTPIIHKSEYTMLTAFPAVDDAAGIHAGASVLLL